jgi:hypothetical protein
MLSMHTVFLVPTRARVRAHALCVLTCSGRGTSIFGRHSAESEASIADAAMLREVRSLESARELLARLLPPPSEAVSSLPHHPTPTPRLPIIKCERHQQTP